MKEWAQPLCLTIDSLQWNKTNDVTDMPNDRCSRSAAGQSGV